MSNLVCGTFFVITKQYDYLGSILKRQDDNKANKILKNIFQIIICSDSHIFLGKQREPNKKLTSNDIIAEDGRLKVL